MDRDLDAIEAVCQNRLNTLALGELREPRRRFVRLLGEDQQRHQ